MADLMDGDLRENRFAYLLQPIRDLSANWDIDIAAELVEYIGELESITFSLEEGDKALNFAEAALLIQGTTCVYSKKVEYLHTLVQQALEAIFSKRQKAVRDEHGNEQAVAAADDDEDEEAFLGLDAMLEEGQDIDIEDDDALGFFEVNRPPAALLALEDHSGGQGDGEAGAYRLATCFVHPSGALLLEVRDGEQYDAELRCTLPQPPAAAEADLMDADYDDDGGDYGGGIDMADDDDDDAPLDHDQPLHQADPSAELPPPADQPELQPGDAPPADMPADMAANDMLQPGYHADHAPSVSGVSQQQQQKYFDPYEPLDMHDKGSMAAKPIKVVKPKVRKGKRTAVAMAAAPAGKLSRAADQLNNKEFEYALDLLALAQRVLQQQARKQQLQARAVGRRGGMQSVLDWVDAAAVQQQEQQQLDELMEGDAAAAEDGAAEDDYLYGGGDDFGAAGADDDSGDDEAPGFDAADVEAEGRLALMKAHPLQALQDPEPDTMTYEELCRAHIESIIAAAAAQEVQTELSQRVSTWRQRIDPVLREEETRSAFDIHVYGEKILTQLGGLSLEEEAAPKPADTKLLRFGEVVSADNKYDISRSFAAMLQLINNQNVAIIKHGGPADLFELELLSAQMLHKQMAGKIGGGEAGAGGAAAGGGGEDVENVGAGGSQGGKARQVKKARKGKAAAA